MVQTGPPADPAGSPRPRRARAYRNRPVGGIAATARRVVRLSDGKIIADHAQEVDWE